ncbi:subtilisin-like protein [Lactarius vividus]|nr:subtilisin-like protein [Lactarius vividus]
MFTTQERTGHVLLRPLTQRPCSKAPLVPRSPQSVHPRINTFRPHRENALVDALNEVSDPSHPRYGMHLSREQVADIVAPHPDTVQLVHSWLEHHRITSSSVSVTHGGSFLTVTGVPVSQANNLLGASYQLYRHTKTNETIIRTLGYSLPVVLGGHVQTVAPTTFFSSQAFLRWLYNTITYVPSAIDRNVIGITGYNQQYPSPADLTSYMSKYRPDGIDATYVVESVNGGEYDPNNPGDEANVNIQLSSAMTYPTPHIFYSTKPSANNDYLLAWLNTMLSKENIPQTNHHVAFPKRYAIQVCNLFAQLGARGVSVLFASGDDGVGRGDCFVFTPLFPATCPYVTTVGGTTSSTPEVAASLSGGGFSEYFPRPSYQQQAVPTFLGHIGHLYSGLYNPGGRGIPDIAAQALEVPCFYEGEEAVAKGTSCSSPIVAGVVSLLNDYRLSQGRPPLGFLNPWLYGGGLNGLNDIVSGSNPGCDTDGFSAIVGWDPVTGLGTPDFLRLMALMDTLDPGSSNPPE